MKLGQTTFRMLEKYICFIGYEGMEENVTISLNDFDDYENGNGILAFCYIDHENGIVFDVLGHGFRDENGEITGFEGNDQIFLRLRWSALENCDVEILDLSNSFYDKYASKINITMMQANERKNEVAEYLRTLNFIDGSRSPENPDILAVLFISEKNGTVPAWVRIEGTDGNMIKSLLLSEPNGDFGVHPGDYVSFGIAEYEGAPTGVVIFD